MKSVNWKYVNSDGFPIKEKNYLVAYSNLHNLKKDMRIDKWENNKFVSLYMPGVYAWTEIDIPPQK